MDDLYENLENYEDINVIDELKEENKNLKLKLEEYALNMDKLQKNILQEFDKLTSEYTKLEKNYSSLLKTARAEVERKTQIITNLNKEKDMMVLNSIKNKNTLNIRRNMNSNNNKNNDGDQSKKNIQPATDGLKAMDSNFVRLEKDKIPIESEVPHLSTGNQHINTKLTNETVSNAKENNSQFNRRRDNDNQIQRRACSIKNRRKSMPASRQSAKYTSDEEYEDSCSREDREFSVRNNQIDQYNKGHERYNNRHSKISEDTSSVDDKHSSQYESLRDMKRWNSKQYDDDRYKNRDRFEHRRNYSPERSHRKSSRHYQEDRYKRSDYGKNRHSESPPRDKFHHYSRRSLEQKSKHDKDYPEKYRHQQHDRYSGKHKLPNEYETGPIKRFKTDSYNRYNEETSQLVSGLQSDVYHPIAGMLQINESCQSPDYVFADAAAVPPIREIRSTAVIQLEDPRISNNRYVVKTVNGKKELSTITGRNVVIQPVDKSEWNIENFGMPEALVQPPSQYREDFIKEVYMDIDNPVSNMSLESGELLGFDSTGSVCVDFVTNKNINDIIPLEVEKNQEHVEKIPQTVNSDNPFMGDKPKSRYKIPKIKNGAPQNNTSNHSVSKNDSHIQLEKINNDKNKSNENLKNYEFNLKEDNSFKNKKMIEADLELSDDDVGEIKPSDPIDVSNPKKIINVEKIRSQEVETKLQDENCTLNANSDSSLKIKIKRKSHKSHKSSKEIHKKEENEQNSQKKMKQKKCEPSKEIKSKFSDLFGESSSLITPEDLGITSPEVQSEMSSYVPIFEDAQDAVDLNLKDAKEKQVLSATPEIQKSETSAVSQHVTDEKPKSITESKKKKPKKILEVKSDTELRNIESPLISKEQKSDNGSEIDTNVVKTVIISTGVQPQYRSVANDPKPVVQQAVASDHNEIDESESVKKVQDTPMKALATSTPERELQLRSLDTGRNLNLPDVSANTNESRITLKESATSIVDQSSDTNLNTQNDADVPDVRIYVKRRKRVTRRETNSK